MGKGGNSTGTTQQKTTTTTQSVASTTDIKVKAPPEQMSVKTSSPKKSFLHRHAFVIILMLDTMVQGLGFTVISQFRYRFFHSQHQDQLDSYNVTRGGECGSKDLDPEVQAIENTISKEAAKWSLYQDYASMAPLFISSLIIGMKSDQIGRRFLFILPFFTSLILYSMLAAIIKFELHFGWFIIAYFLSACTGGKIGMFFAAYALISDTHGKKTPTPSPAATTSPTPDHPTLQDKEKHKASNNEEKEENDENDLDMSRETTRTYKIVALDVGRRLAASIIGFATGYIIHYAGFFYTVVIILVAQVMLLIFAYVFVTETGEQKKSTDIKGPLRTIFKALKDPAKRTTLILSNLGLFFLIFGMVDEFEILRTYQMSPPFCFDAVQLGWLSSESRMKGIFSMPLMWLWKRLTLNEATIAAIGALSYTVAGFVLAAVHYTWVFFANPMIGIPGTLASPIAKAITSRLIGRSALASTFAVILAGEEIFWFVGSISSSYMYQHFLPTVPTAPFYMGAASFAVSTLLFTALSWKEHRTSQQQTVTDKEINIRL